MNVGAILFIVTLCALAAICFAAPTLIAGRRGVEHRERLFLLNVIGGWTVVGWIAALTWSLAAPGNRKVLVHG